MRAAEAARTASREEIIVHIAPPVSPRTIGNNLKKDSDHVCLWPGYRLQHVTAKDGYSGVVNESTGEWNDAQFSSAIRVGYACMGVTKVHVSVIFRSAFAHDTQVPP